MTFIVVLMLGAGVVLWISAVECTSLVQVTQDIWNDKIKGYTWRCQGSSSGDTSGGTSNPCALATPADWCNPGSPCYDPNKCQAVTAQTTFAGPGGSQASRLTPWVQNGWRG